MALAAFSGVTWRSAAVTWPTSNGTLRASTAPAVPVTTTSSRRMIWVDIWKFWVRLAPGDSVTLRETGDSPWREAVTCTACPARMRAPGITRR